MVWKTDGRADGDSLDMRDGGNEGLSLEMPLSDDVGYEDVVGAAEGKNEGLGPVGEVDGI